ncbi:2-octaprenyl-6-methoxyphenyl hydroxylase [Pseudoxanthomonas indica]|uniref:2-octaprenyl-6-methoxyphenol hydroxylase /2-octaprenyl-3-methyl-6-methoxy-1,4-benzoquinol hydroxylase n=1 Tax=Pseudoxanthomonas indica TaxID=428993 RepID=A0A1T5LJV5_9GAMM|nr:2-octaprenyl-6-methoxyphenyl hydroxylase [Pseudoxanthomonas indica]SKC75929.1 2-octaprenyl-6-methoxyphenol hydroxylase /2-octaprenyl-3-methyl-6-methoxy-1,4-benzoquinol hydroxylase [Pseudoxanthomonas indica]
MTERQHDVVIVGGGLVGASLAIALARHGTRDVALVEAAPPTAMPAVFDQRNLSFAAATVNALAALGVMQKLQAPTGAIRRIHISRQGDFGRVRLDAADYGRDRFGEVVVARDFGAALERRLEELPGLTRYRPATFVGLAETDGLMRQVRLHTGTGEQIIGTRLLVAADGTRSAVRAALGIRTHTHDYDQTLFVARVRAEQAPDGTAYERLTAQGPTALLPRGDRHYGVVHGVPTAEADAVAALDEAAWLARLQASVGWRVGRLLASGERSAYPIARVLADAVIEHRAVVLGNAAQTIHPIGAQGFNLGLRDALTLAELIEAAEDPGAAALLAHYHRRREEDRRRTLAFSDGLARLSANPAPLMRPLRSLGMAAIDASGTLQAYLVGGAMGFRGDVPMLCREVAA